MDCDYMIQAAANSASMAIVSAANEHARPSAVYRPRLFLDGSQWCALYGENLMEGVAGFGSTPAAAMNNFDDNWRGQLAPQVETVNVCPKCGDEANICHSCGMVGEPAPVE